jgi:putative membrane protein
MHIVPTILHVGVLALTVLALSRVTAGVWLKNPVAAIPVAVVFSLLNWAIGKLLAVLLWIPGILTLGLVLLFSSLIVNTVLLWLVDKLLASFELKSLRALLLSSSAITLVNWLFHFLSWR